ncbi:MAG: sugar phosphate isomerase/epimerase [Bacteroidota bacterium]|nr:sugar phosphate isomerase/epimerase [Bacteroidota bacterium]
MNYKRRDFLKIGTSLAAGAVIAPGAYKLLSGYKEMEESKKLKKFGLQLYSVRDDIPKDPKGVLKQVASFGYTQIESYEHKDLGMFWGMSNTDFKKYMDGLGMTIISSHCDIASNFEKKAAEAAAIGMKYLMCPWKGPQKSIDDFKKFADEFNQKGEICRKNGIRFAYHNHDYSFKLQDGQLPQDVMMQNTDPKLVDFEMDIYWVVTGGQDPETWLKKYPNRFRACHIKDRIKNSSEHDATCVLGEGSIDFPKILKTAKANGMEYYIVEHERYDNTTPLKAAEADAVYMKKLKV